MSSVSRCEVCRTAIFWRDHVESGIRAPIDVAGRADGTIVLVGDTQYRVLHKAELEALENGLPGMTGLDDVPRYVSHFATCTDPRRFRRISTGGAG